MRKHTVLVLAALLIALITRFGLRFNTTGVVENPDLVSVHSTQVANLPERASTRSVATENVESVKSDTLQTVLPVLSTPSRVDRPVLRFQLNLNGSIEGIFATKPVYVHQVRHITPRDGYYYRVIDPQTGEVLFDGAIPFPEVRHQEHGKDENGQPFIVCHCQSSDAPVLFDLPNFSGRLQVFLTQYDQELEKATQAQPIVDLLLKNS